MAPAHPSRCPSTPTPRHAAPHAHPAAACPRHPASASTSTAPPAAAHTSAASAAQSSPGRPGERRATTQRHAHPAQRRRR
eukprot:scaffold415_cov124-Isochrysis_galbana.AAC.14